MGEIGDALRAARLDLGVDLRRASADTRISYLFLEALEEERFSDLPAAVYVRGFLRSYAGYLGLEGQALIDRLPEPFAAQPVSPQVGFVPGPGRGSATTWPPRPDAGSGEEAVEPTASGESAPPPESGAAPGTFPGRRTVGGRGGGREEPLGHLPPVLPYADSRIPPDRGDEGSRLMGLLLLALAVIIAAGMLGGFLLIVTRGGDGEPLGAGTLETPTATSRTQTVVPPQGSTPTPGGAESTTPGAGSPAATASPGRGTPTPGPRPTTGSENPTATATRTTAPTPSPTSETPTPTATASPTATPTLSPTPTATPFVNHPSRYQECTDGVCGGTTIRIVCAPDGWFVDRADVNGVFPADQYGWPAPVITRELGVSLEEAAAAACS